MVQVLLPLPKIFYQLHDDFDIWDAVGWDPDDFQAFLGCDFKDHLTPGEVNFMDG